MTENLHFFVIYRQILEDLYIVATFTIVCMSLGRYFDLWKCNNNKAIFLNFGNSVLKLAYKSWHERDMEFRLCYRVSYSTFYIP